jgi:hypothetical protein
MIELEQVKLQWVIPEKIHTPPTEEISAVRRGRGEKLFLIIVNVLGHPNQVILIRGKVLALVVK